MNKVKMPISGCNVGDIIADDVINKRGITLVTRNTVVNTFIKEKLTDMGIASVWVYETERNNTDKSERNTLYTDVKKDPKPALYKEVKEDYKYAVLSIKEVINNLSTGKGIDYGKLIEVSDIIYSRADQTDQFLRCLNEVRVTDEYTYSHCVNVSFYAMLLAKWINLDKEDVKGIIQAGLLHDVGKTKVPGMILNKKEPLSPEEFTEIRRHTLYGYDIVKGLNHMSANVKNAILLHHERVDGSGYPYGLAADAIDLYTRIIAVADAYDAMTTDRVYQKRRTPFEAFEMLITIGMRLFDTTVVKALLNCLPPYYVGSNVLLSSGEKGEIVFIPPHNVVKPIINIRSSYIDLSEEDEIKIVGIV